MVRTSAFVHAVPPVAYVVLAAIALLYVSRRYWLAPIRIWRRVVGDTPARYALIDAQHPLPASADTYLAQQAEALSTLGFSATAPYLETADAGATMYHQLHEHGETGDMAAVGAFLRDSDEAILDGTLSLTSAFYDGVEVKTLADLAGLPATRPKPANTILLRTGDAVPFSGSKEDVARLYRIHRAMVRRRGAASQRRLDLSDPIAHHRRLIERGRRAMLESGWYYEKGAELRPTLKGACLLVWPWLPPWSWLRRIREYLMVLALLDDSPRKGVRVGGAGSADGARRMTPSSPDLA
jgi:hypothetical protein